MLRAIRFRAHPPCRNGTSFTNPIDLGSPAKLSRAADSSLYLDSALSGCNYPDFYPTPDRA